VLLTEASFKYSEANFGISIFRLVINGTKRKLFLVKLLPNAEPNFIPLTIEQLGICYENVLLLLQQPLCFYLQILFYPFKQYEVNHEIIVYK